MNRLLLSGIQIAVSMWEIRLCYKMLYIMASDEKYSTRTDKVIMWCVILLVGGALGVNRLNFFFSNLLFFLVNIIVILCVCARKRKILLNTGVIILYFAIVAIMDMAFALISLEFLGVNFVSKVYVYAMTWQKECVFILSRSIVCTALFVLGKKVKNMYEIVEQCKYTVLCIGCILCMLLIKYQFVLDELVNGDGKGTGISASFTLLALVFVAILIEVFEARYQYMKEENKALFLKEQILEERYMGMLKSRQEMHDMRNHLLLIQKYEKEQRWEELHAYLEAISGDILDDSAKMWSGNPIVDLMLNSKKAIAQSRGIEMEINTEIITDFPLNNREIISLFGNLLDNAIEACDKMRTSKKCIYLNMRKQHEVLCIEMENSIEEMPREKNGGLVSDKADQGLHGYGLKNVQRIVDRHEGTYSYQIKENCFITSIAFFDSGEEI